MADTALTADPSVLTVGTNDERLLESLFARLSPSPVALLKAALRFAALHPVPLAPDLLLGALKTQGENEAGAWLGSVEPTLGAQDVMLLTGLSKSGVHKAKEDGRMLAFRLPGQNFDRFPRFQFAGEKVREWIPALLVHTGNGLAAAHFLAVNRKRLKGHSYLELLREKDDPVVIAALLSHAESVGDPAHGLGSEAKTAAARS